MALPRTVEESNKQMRLAAIKRLREEHGVTLSKKRRGDDGVAAAIREVEPSLRSEDPVVLIRAWVALKPTEATPSRLAFWSERTYSLNAQMRDVAAKLKGLPRPVTLSSNVSNFRYMGEL